MPPLTPQAVLRSCLRHLRGKALRWKCLMIITCDHLRGGLIISRLYVCIDCGTPARGAVAGSRGCVAITAALVAAGKLRGRQPPAEVPEPAGSGTDGQRFASLADAVQSDLDALITSHPMANGPGALALNLAESIGRGRRSPGCRAGGELKAALHDLSSWRPTVGSGW
jgi:hypothetical protein